MSADQTRRSIIAGAILAAAIGLAATAYGVFSPAVLEHYSDSPDSVGIARWAEQAGPEDILRWWTGTWIQADSYYYRPLSSMLFWAEYLLFGWNFQGHVFISWLMHGAICVCVYLLALRLLPGPLWRSRLTGLLAVVLVNVRLGPPGPLWPVAPVAFSVVAWWPAQTDQASLLLCLFSLLMLDRWLQNDDPHGLTKAALLWIAALLFKEMSVILPALAGVLIVIRRGWATLRVFERDPEDGRRLRPGLAWRVTIPPTIAVVIFLAIRPLIVPGAWGMELSDPFYVRLLYLMFARPYAILAEGWWLPTAALFTALCLAAWVRAPRRPSVVWLVLALVIGNGAIAQLLAGNFALITIPDQLADLGTLTLLALGIIVLAHVRELWVWGLLAIAVLVHLPLIGVWGPHYFYWPGAFWAIFHAGLVHWLLLRWDDGTLQWNPDAQPRMA